MHYFTFFPSLTSILIKGGYTVLDVGCYFKSYYITQVFSILCHQEGFDLHREQELLEDYSSFLYYYYLKMTKSTYANPSCRERVEVKVCNESREDKEQPCCLLAEVY